MFFQQDFTLTHTHRRYNLNILITKIRSEINYTPDLKHNMVFNKHKKIIEYEFKFLI